METRARKLEKEEKHNMQLKLTPAGASNERSNLKCALSLRPIIKKSAIVEIITHS